MEQDDIKSPSDEANALPSIGNLPDAESLKGLVDSLLGQTGAPGSADLSSILGAMLGGNIPGAPSSPNASETPAATGENSPLSSLPQGGMADLLGALLGGSPAQGNAPSGDTSLAPIVNGLINNMGLPSDMANAVVNLASTLVLNGLAEGTAPAGDSAGTGECKGDSNPATAQEPPDKTEQE